MTSRQHPTTADDGRVGGQDVVRETARGAGWLGLGATVVKAAQTAVLLILAAILEPSALGVITIGSLVLNVTSSVTDVGTSTALVHWRGDVQRAARTAMSLALALGLVLTAVVWVAAPALSSALNAGDLGTDVVRGLMLCLPFIAAAGVSQELLRRAFEFRRRVVPDIIGALAGAALSVGLALGGVGAMALVAGQLVQAVLTLLLLCVLLRPARPGWNGEDARGLLSYGGHLAGSNILQLVMQNLDYLVVARVLGVTALGVYSMAFRLAAMPLVLVTTVVVGAAFAYLCRLEGPDLGRATGDLAVALSSVVLPIYLGMLLLAPGLEVLGSTWAPGVPVLRWLALYGVLASLLQLAVFVLNAAGHPRDGLVLNLANLVLLAAALVVLTPMGIQAVAAGQALAAGLSFVLALLLGRRRLDGLSAARLGRGLLPTLAACLAMTVAALSAAAVPGWTFTTPITLTTGVLVAAAAYVLVLLPVAKMMDQPVLPLLRGAA